MKVAPSRTCTQTCFRATGTSLVKNPQITFPVVDPADADYSETLGFCGSKLIEASEAIRVGYSFLYSA